MWHFELFKMELKVIIVILNYEKYDLYIYIYIMNVTIYIHEQDEYLRV